MVQVFESLAPIIDISLATPFQSQGSQSELLLTSGLNHSTYMTLVKKGIQIKQLYSFKDLGIPLLQQMFAADEYLFLKCFNFDTPLCLKVEGNDFKGIDVSREM